MSKIIYKNGVLELRTWDVVELEDGSICGIFGSAYEHGDTEVNDETPVFLTSSPVSSFISTCYIKHIKRVVDHCGCFENQMNVLFGNHDKSPGLVIHLEKD